jgi:hypothetical protein
MDLSIAELYVILALNPEKGRVSINDLHFRYTLTGALIFDLLEQGEISTDNKRIVPSFRKTGNPLHDIFAEKIMKSSRNRRISFWIKRLSTKKRFILTEIISTLEKEKILRIERKKFLNIFPYYRYWFIDNSVRSKLIEILRGILVYGRQPGKKDIMLLGLVEASRAYRLLSRERGESRLLRKKNTELLKGDTISGEISQAIREVQLAILASITSANVAAYGSH